MTTMFSNLCDQITLASSSSSPFDIPKKPLSNLLNEMTEYVATSLRLENDDQAIIQGLQILLLSDVERVRAASIRALRYSIHRSSIFDKFMENRLDYLICRSLAIDLGNTRERFEAYKFIRRFVILYPLQFPHSFVYILDSIVSSSYLSTLTRPANSTGIIKPDQMIKSSLELLCEIALSNPHALRECHTINTMLHFIVDCDDDELVESVIYALLHAIDRFTINDNSEPTILDTMDSNGPTWVLIDEGMRERHHLIRNIFSQLVAIFPSSEKANSHPIDRRGITSAAYDQLTIKEPDKLKRLKSCSLALKTILHTWIGFTAFCQSENSSIGLLVNCLMVQSAPMKMIIIDLFYDLLNIDIPTVYESFESALKSTYPIWNLTTIEEEYTYVASEGIAKLPRLSSTRPNLLDSHMALILLTCIDAGFLEAITEIASSDNTILSIRSTLLLANFLWLCNEHLPEEQSFLLLPLLMDVAIADDDSIKRSFAKEAMLNINAFFEFQQRTRQTYSFQLAQLINHSQRLNEYQILPEIINKDSLRRKVLTTSDDPLAGERIDKCICDTLVLENDFYRKWNWDLILALLKDFSKVANQIQSNLYERFLDKLFDFFKPEQKDAFNTIELTDPLSNVTCRCLMAFADLLLFPYKPTKNHIKYIASNITRILLSTISNAMKKSLRDGTGRMIISEVDLLTKNTVYYYLFLGRLSRTSIGTDALNENEIFIRLSEMLKMDDDFVISAIVALSSFNYYVESPCRIFLFQALKSSCTSLRLYSTKLLRVILRCNPIAFGHWGLTVVCSQLNDTNQSVLLEAVSILDEALEDKRLVQILYDQWQMLSTVKDKHPFLDNVYHLSFARLCSIPFQQIRQDDKQIGRIRQELFYWDTVFNSQYVTFMETSLFGAYSGGALLTDDYFERRRAPTANGTRPKRKRINIHVPSHIYRQLCLHHDGFVFLRSESRLERYANDIKHHPTNCSSVNETQAIKEALWAVAHTASTENGYNWFVEKDLLADFLRFAEECQNLSVRGTAFYGLSLIAQIPDGAMTLKGFGWETYRVRAHSISSSIVNTDAYQCGERRTSKIGTLSSPTRGILLTNNENVLKRETNDSTNTSKQFRFSQIQDLGLPQLKAKRSLTMPTNILLNSDEVSQNRQSTIDEEIERSTPTSIIATVSFPHGHEPSDGPFVIAIPSRRTSSISKDGSSLSVPRDSSLSSGGLGSFTDIESNRSPSFSVHSYTSQTSSVTVQSAVESLPLERFRPRSKSAHQSNALRQSKQLQKVPEVIQALRAPTATRGGTSEPAATDELYRSRLLRCNFLLKPDATGYEYARRVQEISHSMYSHMNNSKQSYDFNPDKITALGKKQDYLSSLSPYTSKFYKKIYETHSITEQSLERFLTEDGKFSFEQRDLDDADEDGNTVYRGLAIPVDIRQVVEISDGYNLNYETWSDLVRSRSRANTSADLLRGRSATDTSTGSGEFAPMTSPPIQETFIPISIVPSINITSSIHSPSNICMICKNINNGTAHEDVKVATQKDFNEIKSLASRLTVGIHTDEIEKKLLSRKESHPQIFDNICLYSEICHLLSKSSVRINAQRFLHDLFSDCQFQKLRKRFRQVDALYEEDDEEQSVTRTYL